MENQLETSLSHLADASLFEQGGPVMYPLLLVAIVGLTYIIYCLITLRRRAVMSRSLVAVAETLADERDCAEAEKVCRREGGPFAEIIASVIVSRHLPRSEAESIVEGAGRRAAHDLGRGTLALEVVAGIGTLLGLLGTVTGMFSMMMSIRDLGVKEMSSISGGIGEALITTIAGLIISIPAYVAYVYFTRRAEDLVLLMEEYAFILLSRLHRSTGPEAAPAAVPAKEA